MKAFAPFLCYLVVVLSATARADIYRWDNFQLIPGTEGITPGPGVVLDHHELAFAALSSVANDCNPLNTPFLNRAAFLKYSYVLRHTDRVPETHLRARSDTRRPFLTQKRPIKPMILDAVFSVDNPT